MFQLKKRNLIFFKIVLENLAIPKSRSSYIPDNSILNNRMNTDIDDDEDSSESAPLCTSKRRTVTPRKMKSTLDGKMKLIENNDERIIQIEECM